MNLLVSPDGQPTPVTRYAAHALVGVAVYILIAKYVGPVPALVSAAAAMVAHEAFDAPVADTLAEVFA